MNVQSTLMRANKELQKGRIWRAKEILASSLPNYGFNAALYEQYANVLMQMGDELEAGRFYLLCVEQPDLNQQRAIDLFVTRHAKKSYRELLKLFPRAARFDRLDAYPQLAQEFLKSREAPEVFPFDPSSSVEANAAGSNHAFAIGCCVVGASGIFFALLGVFQLIKMLFF